MHRPLTAPLAADAILKHACFSLPAVAAPLRCDHMINVLSQPALFTQGDALRMNNAFRVVGGVHQQSVPVNQKATRIDFDARL